MMTNPKHPIEALHGHRVLVGPNEISGVASRIAVALAGGGADVLFFNEQDHPFDPKIDESPTLRRLLWGTVKLASRWQTRKGPAVWAGLVLARLVKTLAFVWACVWARTIVVVGGKGFLNGTFEYLLLRLLGRRVVHVFIGTASRPRYLSGYAPDSLKSGVAKPREFRRLAVRTARQARRVRGVSRRASVVIENPLCGHFHTRPFVNWFKLGLPLDVAALEQRPRVTGQTPPKPPGHIRVLHSPTVPRVKGSVRIREVIERLVAEGMLLEFRQITGVSHAQVMHEIAESDFVVDQLYSDSPLAGFAAEAAALGKAAVVGGYGWRLFPQFLLPEETPPTATCHPDELEATVRGLAMDTTRRAELGTRARQFLQDQWSEAAFAERFARVVTGEIPAEWWVKPEEVRYLHGLGLAEEEARRLVRGLVETNGPRALQLDHVPRLRERMVAFGRGEPVPV